jgi:O-antigen ligase
MKNTISFMRTGILVLAALTSLLAVYIAGGLFFPFITGKAFIFRTLVELMLLLYIPLAVVAPEYRPKKSLGLYAYGAFMIVLLVANLQGVNVSNSLWSNFERMEGYVTHAHLFVFTVILLSLQVTAIEWKRLLQFHLAASTLVLFAAFAEYLNILKQLAAGQSVGLRLSATLGNSAYLSIYCAFNMFFACILIAQRKLTFSTVSSGYAILAVLHLFVLWQTQTRGTVLGLIAGGFVALTWYSWKNRANDKIRQATILVFGFLVSILFVFIISKDTAFVQNNPTLKRLAAIELGEQTVRSRLMIIQMSYEGFKERPLLGYGQDNFVYVFADKYNPEMFDQEQWFDRSHNVFFDWLIAAGILGLLTYLSLYAVIVYTVIRNTEGRFSTAEQALILGLLATYFVHNVIVFDNLVSYISFFLLFAYVMAPSVAKLVASKKQSSKQDNKVVPLLAGFVIAILLSGSAFYAVVWNPYKLNTSIIEMFQLGQKQVTLEQVKEVALRMTAPSLYGNSEANEQLLTLVSYVVGSAAADSDKQYFYQLAKSRFDAEIEHDSKNPRQAVLFGSKLIGFGQYAEAIRYYEIGLARTPKKTMLWSELAQVKQAAGDTAGAVAAARISHQLSPRSIDSAVVLTTIFATKAGGGSREDIEAVWQKTIEANKYSQDSMTKELAYYKRAGDEVGLQKSFLRFSERFPTLAGEAKAFIEKSEIEVKK